MLNRFWERFAIRILIKSKNISLFCFKDKDLDPVFMAVDRSDVAAAQFFDANRDVEHKDPNSMMLERLFHAPDAEGRD